MGSERMQVDGLDEVPVADDSQVDEYESSAAAVYEMITRWSKAVGSLGVICGFLVGTASIFSCDEEKNPTEVNSSQSIDE